MSNKLIYRTTTGEGGEEVFYEEQEEIRLQEREIVQIDLSPLSSCLTLQWLDLSWNSLEKIDLSPLSSCTRLRRLDLTSSKLESIDLSPLGSCLELEFLSLAYGNIKSIDLSPLSSCTNLRTLDLHGIPGQKTDFAPLRFCTSLRTLKLGGMNLESINLSFLSSCSCLFELSLNGNKLQSIDLTPLAGRVYFEKLDLSCNELQEINLSPLNSCILFSELNVSSNKLQKIDFTPLSSLARVRTIILANNRLQDIDLAPLSSCFRLHNLNLSSNLLQTIDLAPLGSNIEIRHVSLEHNQLETTIDLTSVAGVSWLNQDSKSHYVSWLKSERDTFYDRPSGVYPWSFLHQVNMSHCSDWRVQHDILYALGLKNHGFIDTDLWDLFNTIPPKGTLEVVRKSIAEYLVEVICKTVDRGGTTTGLNLRELSLEHSEIAVRNPAILENRAKEMNSVSIAVVNGKADLKELWVTAQGYEILSALNMELFTDIEGLGTIEKIFVELDLDLKICNSAVSGVEMSHNLKDCIWWIVANKGKNWSEIRY